MSWRLTFSLLSWRIGVTPLMHFSVISRDIRRCAGAPWGCPLLARKCADTPSEIFRPQRSDKMLGRSGTGQGPVREVRQWYGASSPAQQREAETNSCGQLSFPGCFLGPSSHWREAKRGEDKMLIKRQGIGQYCRQKNKETNVSLM